MKTVSNKFDKDIISFNIKAVYIIIDNAHLKQIYKSILVSFQRSCPDFNSWHHDLMITQRA